MNIKRTILLAAAVGLAGAAGLPNAQASGTTYRAPYLAGPQGGTDDDGGLENSHVDANTETGQVTVMHLSLTPGPVGCASTGGMAYLRVEHPVNGTEDKVLLYYENASLTPYTWIKVNVYAPVDGERLAIGSTSLRGQKVAEKGTIIVPLDADTPPDPGSVMTIDFGIEAGSACPNLDGGTVTFPTVAVN